MLVILKGDAIMDWVTLGSGLVLCVYGFYTMVMRTKRPEKLFRLKAMMGRYGDINGTAVHIVAFTVLPVILGILMSFRGLISIVIG